LAAAFWLTIAATPDGAHGQVTFQLSCLLPQPVSIDKARTPAVTNAAIRFFIILLSFFVLPFRVVASTSPCFCYQQDNISSNFKSTNFFILQKKLSGKRAK
jgi:hypothetical protein